MRRSRRDPDPLLPLIDLAYAAAEPGGSWEPFLTALADQTGGRSALLLQHDLTLDGGVSVGVRSDPEALRLYNAHWAHHDPRALSPRAARLALPGRGVPDQALVKYSEVEKTAFHNDFTRRYEMSRLMTIALSRTPTSFVGVSIMRSDRDEPFERVELETLERIAGHAARALRLEQTIRLADASQLGTLAATDALQVGIIGISTAGTALFANREGRRLADARDGFSLNRSLPAAARRVDTERLRRSVDVALRIARGEALAAPAVVLLPRPSGRPPLQVVPLPVPEAVGSSSHSPALGALLLIVDPEWRGDLDTAILSAVFGLTPAEARFATALAQGLRPAEIGARLKLSRATVRWFTEQVRLKTRTRTQAAAVRALLTSIASLGTRMPLAER